MVMFCFKFFPISSLNAAVKEYLITLSKVILKTKLAPFDYICNSPETVAVKRNTIVTTTQYTSPDADATQLSS